MDELFDAGDYYYEGGAEEREYTEWEGAAVPVVDCEPLVADGSEEWVGWDVVDDDEDNEEFFVVGF